MGANPPASAAGDTLYWDGHGVMDQSARSQSASEPLLPAMYLALPLTLSPAEVRCPSVTRQQTRPGITARDMHWVPACPAHAMDWETLAALAIFYLDPRLLGDRCHDGSRGVHGALVWVRRQEGTASDAPAVRPAVIVEAASRLGQTERLEIIPRFHTGDPLRHHLGLVLQAASTATGE